MRSGRKQFTYSKVMAWVAFDRAIKYAERCGQNGHLKGWREIRDAIHREVCEKGFDSELNSFTQTYGSKRLDASLLLIPQLGFLPVEDKRVLGTIDAIEKNLMRDGLVQRYDTSELDDGVNGHEGSFIACSFWLVSALNLCGRRERGAETFERLLSLRNDVGTVGGRVRPAGAAAGRQLSAGAVAHRAGKFGIRIHT